MSYPSSRSPHLSGRLLPRSLSWVQTFEVDGRGEEGRGAARSGEALQHRGQRPLQTPRQELRAARREPGAAWTPRSEMRAE